MGKPKVLLIGDIVYAKPEWDSLSSIAELVKVQSTNRTDFLAEARSGAFDGVLAAFRAFNAASITGQFDAEIASVMPSSFRFLCQNGAGYDPIDVDACTERDIRVANVPEVADEATAVTALFLLLGAMRAFNPCLMTLREGKFKGDAISRQKLGHDPKGKVLGILGMGGIGRNLARKVATLGMSVQYCNRNKLSDELSEGAKYVSFDELLATSDVLSLNLPLNKHTRHIISSKEFAKMKDGIIIINTARGPVMDEAALVAALDSGKVASCGLDVFEEEPEIHPGLVANQSVVLLPHCGTMTFETWRAMEIFTVENVRRAVEEGRLKGLVPEQAGKGW